MIDLGQTAYSVLLEPQANKLYDPRRTVSEHSEAVFSSYLLLPTLSASPSKSSEVSQPTEPDLAAAAPLSIRFREERAQSTNGAQKQAKKRQKR